MAGSKQQKLMHGRGDSPEDPLDMKSFYTILKSHVEILLEGSSVLRYSNTGIFPLARKVSKLQKLLSAKRLYHRKRYILCVYPAEAYLAFWVLWQAGQWAHCVAAYISET